MPTGLFICLSVSALLLLLLLCLSEFVSFLSTTMRVAPFFYINWTSQWSFCPYFESQLVLLSYISRIVPVHTSLIFSVTSCCETWASERVNHFDN